MKKLLVNQYCLLRGLLSDIMRTARTSIHMAICDFRDIGIRKRLNSNLVHELLEKPQIIEAFAESLFPEEPVRITFMGAIRRVGNPNHRLERFIKSLLENVKDVRRVEVLVAVDSDDDMDHFVQLKKKYSNQLRFRVFVSPVRYSYENLHLYDRVQVPHMAHGSRMMCRYSDDSVITLKDFDEKLLEIDAEYPDNIYFIQTRTNDREKFIGDVSIEQLRLFWIFNTIFGCYSYFPIISKGVLQCAEDGLKLLPENKRDEWSPYANAAITDCYVDMLGTFVKAEGVDRIHELDMIDLRHGRYVEYQNKRDKNGLTANNRFFLKMLSQETIAHMKTIAKVIAEAAQENPARVSNIRSAIKK